MPLQLLMAGSTVYTAPYTSRAGTETLSLTTDEAYKDVRTLVEGLCVALSIDHLPAKVIVGGHGGNLGGGLKRRGFRGVAPLRQRWPIV